MPISDAEHIVRMLEAMGFSPLVFEVQHDMDGNIMRVHVSTLNLIFWFNNDGQLVDIVNLALEVNRSCP